MKLTDYIIRFDNLFNPYLIDKIKNYMNTEKLISMEVGNEDTARISESVRNVKGFTVMNMFPITKYNATKWILFKQIAIQLKLVHLNYLMMTTKKPDIIPSSLVQVDFLKYEVGGKYETHIDGGEIFRNLSTIVNLNEEYEGGEFLFFNPLNREEVIREEKLKKGSVLCFPSNFTYPHSVKPITKGERFSCVCWTQ
jgi:Rps23 Pro-64 3,4-dihydroxylase Tpa1-like proline 4-hydroxylase